MPTPDVTDWHVDQPVRPGVVLRHCGRRWSDGHVHRWSELVIDDDADVSREQIAELAGEWLHSRP